MPRVFKSLPDSKTNAVMLKGTVEWFLWLSDFARSRGVTRQGLLVEAVRDLAWRSGHRAPPVRGYGRIDNG